MRLGGFPDELLPQGNLTVDGLPIDRVSETRFFHMLQFFDLFIQALDKMSSVSQKGTPGLQLIWLTF